MFSIAQSKKKCNGENEQKFVNPSGDNHAISQECMSCHQVCDAGMHEAIANLRGFGRLRDLIAAEVLSGSNEKALDILRTCGCNIFIPGTVFTTLNEFAKFYGVKNSYIQSIMNRWGIVQKKTPSDCTRGDFYYFARRHGVPERYSISRRHPDYVLCDKLTHRQMVFSHSQNGNFYSARVVLAFAAMMYYGKNIHPDAVGNQVFETLRGSTYFDAAQTAMAKQAEARQKQLAATVLDTVSAPEEHQEDGAVINDDGKVVMTPEFFAGIIKTAIHEAIAEVSKTIVPAVPAVAAPPIPPVAKTDTKYTSTGRPVKMVKPSNWDAVLAQYKSGEITRTNAAHQVGMSVGSFDNYRKGQRQFLS